MSYRFIDAKGEHLHTLDEHPLIGTSSVVSVIAKPLVWWASGLAVKELGWLNPKETEYALRIQSAAEMQNEILSMPPEEYLALLDKAYAAHSKSLKKSADKGTDMHAVLESYVKACILQSNGEPQEAKSDEKFIVDFSKWAVENVKRFLVSEGHCYSSELWVGGIIDAVCELKDGRIGILDFKSSKESYKSQFAQIGGYSIQITENGVFNAEGEQIYKLEEPISFHAVIPFGASEFKVDFSPNIEADKEAFNSALNLYRYINL